MGHHVILPLHAHGRGPLQRMSLGQVVVAGPMSQTTRIHTNPLKV